VASHNDEHRKVSERSQYLAPSKTAPPRVVTGAVGDTSKSSYRLCEDEPIRIPGAVQSFGALIGLKYSGDGSLEVRVASENSRKILGYGPEQLFALSSFLDVLKPEVQEEMVARVDHVLEDVDATKEETRLDVFQMVLTFPYEPDMRLWCALHLAPNSEGLVICEFEEYTEAFYLKDASVAKVLPFEPIHSSTSDATPEEFQKSTTSGSKPLPVLEVARKRGNKEFSSLDVFNAMTQAQKQLSDCTSVETVMDVVVGIISELTGFHRVMLYRFDSQKNGSVDAELVNPQASTDIFRGNSIQIPRRLDS
jgi:light-regulated signal transduction histidine kinase (bacteriophytochrome)